MKKIQPELYFKQSDTPALMLGGIKIAESLKPDTVTIVDMGEYKYNDCSESGQKAIIKAIKKKLEDISMVSKEVQYEIPYQDLIKYTLYDVSKQFELIKIQFQVANLLTKKEALANELGDKFCIL